MTGCPSSWQTEFVQTKRVTIDSIEIDATLTEKHSEAVELTKHPVSRGADPADHARVQPQKVAIDGLLSNTSTSPQEQIKRGGPSAPGDAGAGLALMNQLRDLLRERRVVTISTSTAFYQDMMMTSLELPVDAKTGDAVRFSATFERVVFVSTEAVRLSKAARPRDQTKPVVKVDQGKKQPTDVTGNRQIDATWLKGWTNGATLTPVGSGVLLP